MKFRSIIFIAALVFFSCFYSINAQVPPPPPPPVIDEGVIKIDSRLVVVPVSVLDSAGQPVLGLKDKDFLILEENKPQQIEQVSDAEKVPLEIALLFDISASTDAMFKFEQATAAKFLQEVMRPEDRATIFTVGADGKVVQSRVSAVQAGDAIKSIVPTKEQTAFFDSVGAAAEYLQKNSPEGRRKVIVVISDGEDTNSKGVLNSIWNAERKFMSENTSNDQLRALRVKARDDAKIAEQKKVLKSLQNADAVFYSVNPAGSSYKLNQVSVFGQSNMEKFANDTGGTAFLPKFLPIDLKSEFENSVNLRKNSEMLEGIFRQLANELRAQYLVQYYSDSDFSSGKYVNLKVNLTNQQPHRVRARQGYFVKN